MTYNSISRSICPFCLHKDIQYHFTATDYSVSGESFEVWRCMQCAGEYTQRAPAASDIGKYYASDNYISHSDTRKGMMSQIYHRVRARMLQSKSRLLEQWQGASQKRLLDIGCGTGYFLNTLQQKGWQVQGVEVSEGARHFARERFGLQVADTLSAVQGSGAQHFDAITLWHVLEHVHDLDAYWQQFGQLLAPQGTLIIAVPNHQSYDARHYWVHWAAWDVPRHLYHFSPKSMEILAKRHGFEIAEKRQLPFDPFYVALLSEKYRRSGFGWLRGGITGFWSWLQGSLHTERASSVIYILRRSNS